jgi:hypothetical protein
MSPAEIETAGKYNRGMRRLWVLLVLLVLACRSFTPLPAAPLTTETFPAFIQIPATMVAPVSPERLPTATLISPALATMQPWQEMPYAVRIHPDGKLYVGDQVSFEVIIPPDRIASAQKVQVRLGQDPLKLIAEAPTAPFGIGGRMQATMSWAWDTSSLEAGDYALTFTAEPGGDTWTETVSLLPQRSLPGAEKEAKWATARSACCTINYITGTAAERDLPDLLKLADEQAQDAEQRMGVQASEPITITLLPRLLGQGGFANNAINVSYLDRNYSAGDIGIILHHEMIHILDYRLGGELRPSLLTEGLAVYMTGGHFKQEALLPRAAALLDQAGSTELPGLGGYIPLKELADHFYAAQHETGYIEGGALVTYMVERRGWEAFSAFYRDIHPQPSGSQAEAIEASLSKHFNLTLADLEAGFLERLRQEPVEAGTLEDVRQTVSYYDTVRRYQELLDPSAYYMTAWLPDPGEMQRRGIVADYLRQPVEPANLALETLLAETGAALKQEKYAEVERNLDAVNNVLDGVQAGEREPFARDARARDYFQIVTALKQGNFTIDPFSRGMLVPQKIQVEGNQAQAWVNLEGTELKLVALVRTPEGWQLASFWEGAWITRGLELPNSAFSTLFRWKRLNLVLIN